MSSRDFWYNFEQLQKYKFSGTAYWQLLLTVSKSQPAFTCSKITIETLEQWRRSGVRIVNFEYISHLVLMFLLLTLNM